MKTVQSEQFIEIDPESVVVDKKANSRPIRSEDVNERMKSILAHGQQTPVLVYQKDGKYELAVGYHRHAAVLKLNKQYPDRARKLLARIIPGDMTPVQAYTMSVVENYQRRNPTAIEIAKQAQTLMDEFGKSEKDVAEGVFGFPRGNDGLEKLRSFLKLLTLPKKVQDKVESKELPYTAAIELAGLEEAEINDILGSAKRKKSGKIKGDDVRKKARAKKGRGGGEGELSRKKIMNFVIGLTGPGEDEAVRTLARKLEAYFDGKLAFDTAEVWFRSLGGAIKSPKTRQEANPEPEPAPDDEPKPKKKTKKGKKAKAKKQAPKKRAASRPKSVSEPEPAPADDEPEEAPED